MTLQYLRLGNLRRLRPGQPINPIPSSVFSLLKLLQVLLILHKKSTNYILAYFSTITSFVDAFAYHLFDSNTGAIHMYLHPKYDTQNKQIRFDSAPIANNHVYGYSLLEQQTIIFSAIICKLLLCLSCLCAFA